MHAPDPNGFGHLRTQLEEVDRLNYRAVQAILQNLQQAVQGLQERISCPVPEYRGSTNIENEYDQTLNSLLEVLPRLETSDAAAFAEFFRSCCNALGMVQEFLYQERRESFLCSLGSRLLKGSFMEKHCRISWSLAYSKLGMAADFYSN